MDSNLSKRGGKREGAGRPVGINQKSIQVKLNAGIAELIASESSIKLPTNRNQYINQAIIEKLAKDGYFLKGVIFDFDYTLLDTSVLLPIIAEIQNHPSENEKDKLWARHDKLVKKCKMYKGMDTVLDFIRRAGIKLTIVTNSIKRRIEVCTKEFDIPTDEIVGRFSIKPQIPILKPDKRLFEKALDLMCLSREDVISFGNTADDILAAHNAGVQSVACKWGASKEEWEEMLKSKPTFTIERPIEIIPLLINHNTN